MFSNREVVNVDKGIHKHTCIYERKIEARSLLPYAYGPKNGLTVSGKTCFSFHHTSAGAASRHPEAEHRCMSRRDIECVGILVDHTKLRI